jgi:hypothetical protein
MAVNYLWIPVMVAASVLAVIVYGWLAAMLAGWVARRFRPDSPLLRESERLRTAKRLEQSTR